MSGQKPSWWMEPKVVVSVKIIPFHHLRYFKVSFSVGFSACEETLSSLWIVLVPWMHLFLEFLSGKFLLPEPLLCLWYLQVWEITLVGQNCCFPGAGIPEGVLWFPGIQVCLDRVTGCSVWTGSQDALPAPSTCFICLELGISDRREARNIHSGELCLQCLGSSSVIE